jgi:plastocyanin
MLAGAMPASAQDTTTVDVGDIWFCDASYANGVCDTTITAGDTVVWDFSGASLPHTATHCGDSCDAPTSSPLWDSGVISDGSTFSHTFTEPGTYLYHCEVHSSMQRGRVIVQEPAATSTPRLSTPIIIVDGFSTPAATSTPGPVLPPTGRASDDDSSGWPTIAGVGLLGIALGAICIAAVRKVRG